MKSRSGLTLVECLLTCALLSFVLSFLLPALTAFFLRLDLLAATRHVTAALQQARYLAVRENRAVRVVFSARAIRLEMESGGEWKVYRELRVGGRARLSGNAAPVFYPTGFAVPLCRVEVWCRERANVVTLSAAGRFSARRLR